MIIGTFLTFFSIIHLISTDSLIPAKLIKPSHQNLLVDTPSTYHCENCFDSTRLEKSVRNPPTNSFKIALTIQPPPIFAKNNEEELNIAKKAVDSLIEQNFLCEDEKHSLKAKLSETDILFGSCTKKLETIDSDLIICKNRLSSTTFEKEIIQNKLSLSETAKLKLESELNATSQSYALMIGRFGYLSLYGLSLKGMLLKQLQNLTFYKSLNEQLSNDLKNITSKMKSSDEENQKLNEIKNKLIIDNLDLSKKYQQLQNVSLPNQNVSNTSIEFNCYHDQLEKLYKILNSTENENKILNNKLFFTNQTLQTTVGQTAYLSILVLNLKRWLAKQSQNLNSCNVTHEEMSKKYLHEEKISSDLQQLMKREVEHLNHSYQILTLNNSALLSTLKDNEEKCARNKKEMMNGMNEQIKQLINTADRKGKEFNSTVMDLTNQIVLLTKRCDSLSSEIKLSQTSAKNDTPHHNISASETTLAGVCWLQLSHPSTCVVRIKEEYSPYFESFLYCFLLVLLLTAILLYYYCTRQSTAKSIQNDTVVGDTVTGEGNAYSPAASAKKGFKIFQDSQVISSKNGSSFKASESNEEPKTPKVDMGRQNFDVLFEYDPNNADSSKTAKDFVEPRQSSSSMKLSVESDDKQSVKSTVPSRQESFTGYLKGVHAGKIGQDRHLTLLESVINKYHDVTAVANEVECSVNETAAQEQSSINNNSVRDEEKHREERNRLESSLQATGQQLDLINKKYNEVSQTLRDSQALIEKLSNENNDQSNKINSLESILSSSYNDLEGLCNDYSEVDDISDETKKSVLGDKSQITANYLPALEKVKYYFVIFQEKLNQSTEALEVERKKSLESTEFLHEIEKSLCVEKNLNNQLKVKLDKKTSEVNEFKVLLDEINYKLEVLTEENSLKDQELHSSRALLGAANKQVSDIAQSAIDTSRALLEEMKKKVTALKENKRKLQKEFDSLTKHLAGREAYIKGLEEEQNIISEDSSITKLKLSELTTKIAEMNELLKKTKEAGDERDSAVLRLEDEISKLISNNDQATTQLHEKDNALNNLNNALLNKNNDIAVLMADLSRKDVALEEFRTLFNQLKNQIQAENVKKDAEIMELQKATDMLNKSHVEELKKLNESITQLGIENDQLVKKIQISEHELEEKSQRLQVIDEEAERLREEIDALSIENTKLNELVSEQESQNKDLLEECKRNNLAIVNLSKSVEETRNEQQLLNAAKCSQLDAKIQGKDVELDNLKKQLEKAVSDMQSAITDRDAKISLIENLKKEMNSLTLDFFNTNNEFQKHKVVLNAERDALLRETSFSVSYLDRDFNRPEETSSINKSLSSSTDSHAPRLLRHQSASALTGGPTLVTPPNTNIKSKPNSRHQTELKKLKESFHDTLNISRNQIEEIRHLQHTIEDLETKLISKDTLHQMIHDLESERNYLKILLLQSKQDNEELRSKYKKLLAALEVALREVEMLRMQCHDNNALKSEEVDKVSPTLWKAAQSRNPMFDFNEALYSSTKLFDDSMFDESWLPEFSSKPTTPNAPKDYVDSFQTSPNNFSVIPNLTPIKVSTQHNLNSKSVDDFSVSRSGGGHTGKPTHHGIRYHGNKTLMLRSKEINHKLHTVSASEDTNVVSDMHGTSSDSMHHVQHSHYKELPLTTGLLSGDTFDMQSLPNAAIYWNHHNSVDGSVDNRKYDTNSVISMFGPASVSGMSSGVHHSKRHSYSNQSVYNFVSATRRHSFVPKTPTEFRNFHSGSSVDLHEVDSTHDNGVSPKSNILESYMSPGSSGHTADVNHNSRQNDRNVRNLSASRSIISPMSDHENDHIDDEDFRDALEGDYFTRNVPVPPTQPSTEHQHETNSVSLSTMSSFTHNSLKHLQLINRAEQDLHESTNSNDKNNGGKKKRNSFSTAVFTNLTKSNRYFGKAGKKVQNTSELNKKK